MMQQEKSFARTHLSKHGWEEGKGLGKTNNGIKDAIKVKVKNNKGGLGHDHGSDFTFHWWDHIFNKAASSIEVSSDGEDVKLKKTDSKKVTPLLISNKKPLRSSFQGKPLVYGSFVRAGNYDPSSKSSDKIDSESCDSSDDDENDNYFGSDTLEKTFNLTGLTGHKAARHGHKMNGKLQRIQDQESNNVTPSIGNSVGKSIKRKQKSTDADSTSPIAKKKVSPEVDKNEDQIKKKKKKKEKHISEIKKISKKKKKRKSLINE